MNNGDTYSSRGISASKSHQADKDSLGSRKSLGITPSVLWLLISLVLLSVLTACGSSFNSDGAQIVPPTKTVHQTLAASSILTSCPQNSSVISPLEHSTREGITYQVVGARGATAFKNRGLLETEGNEAWLFLTLFVRNESEEVLSLDSDDFQILADGVLFKEDGSNSGPLNNEIDTKDMGNIVGSTVQPKEEMTFGMLFRVPLDAKKYELVLLDENEQQLDLNGLLQQCKSLNNIVPTPTVEPSVTVTPAPTATRVITPTISTTHVPTKPAATKTPTQTATISPGTDEHTIQIMNNLVRYQNTRITIRGEVYLIGDIDGQTVMVLTDGSSYFFNVVYDGALPTISAGDVVIVEGLLLDRTLDGSPLVSASRVVED